MKDETTPSPWYIEQDADTWHLLDGKSNDLLSECDMPVEVAKANAKLAASAPILKELVEKQDELIKLHDLWEWSHENVEQMDVLYKEIETLKSKLK